MVQRTGHGKAIVVPGGRPLDLDHDHTENVSLVVSAWTIVDSLAGSDYAVGIGVTFVGGDLIQQMSFCQSRSRVSSFWNEQISKKGWGC